MNSSIQKYIKVTMEKDMIIPSEHRDFNVLIKTPINYPKPSTPIMKQEPLLENNNLIIKQEDLNQKNHSNCMANSLSTYSRNSFESCYEEINFDHSQYLDIMHKLSKEPLKLHDFSLY